MHELSTCQRIIRQIEKITKNYPGQRIESIQLSVGELARVDTQELLELFPLAAKDTVAQGAKLRIENVSIEVTCNECHKISLVHATDLSCNYCKSENTALSGGTDMVISSIDFFEST